MFTKNILAVRHVCLYIADLARVRFVFVLISFAYDYFSKAKVLQSTLNMYMFELTLRYIRISRPYLFQCTEMHSWKKQGSVLSVLTLNLYDTCIKILYIFPCVF